ncbi:MAG: 4'-phosphopantetheinyl transferase superfamily protein [Rhodobacteraceae bacterium]|nr:4'-phosphopantetheinyl transferase superfamily protein [Paracoccaceae bacterium]
MFRRPVKSGGKAWWRFFRRIGRIEIECIDLKEARSELHRIAALLDPNELTRFRNALTETARVEFATCRATLRAVLCRRLGCSSEQLSLDPDASGKPQGTVLGRAVDCHFNVSHSRPHALIARSPRRPVGVDIEIRRRVGRSEAIVDRMFSASEARSIQRRLLEGDPNLFLDLWTAKEALAKALGTGILRNPQKLRLPKSLINGAHSATIQNYGDSGGHWTIQRLGNSDYAAALAYETGPARNEFARMEYNSLTNERH